MKQFARFKIHLQPGGRGYVEINGERLPMVRDVYVEGRLDGVPIVHITFVGEDVEITGEGEVTDEARAARIKDALDAQAIAREVQRILKRTYLMRSP